MMEAHNFVTIDSWGKFRASTVPLNPGNDGTTAGLPQALGDVPIPAWEAGFGAKDERLPLHYPELGRLED